jgi:hypothetical protein
MADTSLVLGLSAPRRLARPTLVASSQPVVRKLGISGCWCAIPVKIQALKGSGLHSNQGVATF